MHCIGLKKGSNRLTSCAKPLKGFRLANNA